MKSGRRSQISYFTGSGTGASSEIAKFLLTNRLSPSRTLILMPARDRVRRLDLRAGLKKGGRAWSRAGAFTMANHQPRLKRLNPSSLLFRPPPSLPSHPIPPSVSETLGDVGRSVGGVGYSSLRDGWMDRWMLGCSVGWVRLMWRFCGTRCIAERDRRSRRRRRRRRRQRNAIASERMRE